MINVIAGEERQIADFAFRNGIPKQRIRSIRFVEQLRGQRFETVILIGTWKEKPNIDDLMTVAKSQCMVLAKDFND